MGWFERPEFGANVGLIDEIYRQYLDNPESVSPAWRDFFAENETEDGGPEAATEEEASAPAGAVDSREQPASGPATLPDGGPHTAAGGGAAPEGEEPKAGERAEAEEQPTAGDRPKGEEQPGAEGRPKAKAAAHAPGAEDRPKAKERTGAEGRAKAKPAAPAPEGEEGEAEAQVVPLRGAAARIVEAMEASREVPTATSVRTVPARLLEVNRSVLNGHLRRRQGGKVSFTHMIAYAVVKALEAVPVMTTTYREVDGKPNAVRPAHVNLGLAVDTRRPDGSRTLLVPNIKRADTLDFAAFVRAYEEIIAKVKANKLAVKDFADTTLTPSARCCRSPG
jgi:multifunctional 2-oxoglutarate metabolism enzyme